MMAGNPNWWSMNSMHPQLSSQFLYATSTSSLSANTTPPDNPTQDFPVRGGEEERYGGSLFQQQKKLENWEDQVLNLNPSFTRVPVLDVKQEIPQSTSQLYNDHDEFQANHIHRLSNSWPPYHQLMPVSNSSPTSCITTLSSSNNNNILNFSDGKAAAGKNVHQAHNQDHSSECNSTSTGGVSKKPRVQQSSAQPALKTDTASVLSEAIGYIRFLQAQIEFLNDQMGMEGRGPSKQDSQTSRGVKDLRSRGLCLVPISCTQNVENDGGATDYWAPAAALGGGF
ncbi:Transcription factor [Sesamum angolense]|uniref:Transcription factor n=1 Tax=Sesamum angolense TaxID=2727404 RepID=A0AAE1XFL4_9LAMI|nr:Transcription factor [Sesamum angolense]